MRQTTLTKYKIGLSKLNEVEYQSSDEEKGKSLKVKSDSWSRVYSKQMMDIKIAQVFSVNDDVKSCKKELSKLKAMASEGETFLFDPDQYDR